MMNIEVHGLIIVIAEDITAQTCIGGLLWVVLSHFSDLFHFDILMGLVCQWLKE